MASRDSVAKINGVGFHVDLNHFDPASLKIYIKKLKKLKPQWVRIEIDWKKYDDPKKILGLKTFCILCKENNILIIGLLSQFIPATLSNLIFPHYYHKSVFHNIPEYSIFTKNIVLMLKNEIYHWEIWNEQNSKRFWINRPSPKEYLKFLVKMKKIISKISPKSQLIFGGINGNDITAMLPMPKSHFQYTGYLKKCLQLGAAKHINYIAFHPYTLSCYISLHNGKKIAETLKKRIFAMKHLYGKHRLVITEIGVSSTLNIRIKPKDIAYIYNELTQFCQKIDIPICLYALTDHNPKYFSRANPDRDFGFLDHNLREKEIYYEYMKVSKK